MTKPFEEHFFIADSFDREIEKKLRSRQADPAALFKAFQDALPGFGFTSGDGARLGELFENHLSKLKYRHQNPNYLTHPVRVAASYLYFLKQVSYEDAAVALAHNLEEVAPGTLTTIEERLLPAAAKRPIAAAAVDRQKQNDPAYLDAYFDAIAAMGARAMLLRGLDKLDNALGCLFLEKLPEYMAINLRYVCPRLEKVYPDLARYLADLSVYVQKPGTRKRFHAYDPAGASRSHVPAKSAF